MNDMILFFVPKRFSRSIKSEKMSVFSCMDKAFNDFIKNEYTMIVVDLSTSAEHGLYFIEKIREVDRLIPVIFLARDSTYLSEALHKFHCYDYIVTDFCENVLEKILCECKLVAHNQRRNENDFICVAKNKTQTFLKVASIKYVIYDDKKSCIVFDNEESFYANESLKSILVKSNNKLIQCHRGILVNPDKIKTIDFYEKKIVLLQGNISLDIGRKYESRMRQFFSMR